MAINSQQKAVFPRCIFHPIIITTEVLILTLSLLTQYMCVLGYPKKHILLPRFNQVLVFKGIYKEEFQKINFGYKIL